MMESRHNVLWKYVVVCEDDESKAECSICKTQLSCSSISAKNFTTSALKNHPRFKHPDEYAAVEAAE